MTQLFTFNDLSRLPPPAALQALDYESLFEQRKALFGGLQPALLDNVGNPVIRQAELVSDETGLYWRIPTDATLGLWYLELESDPITRLLQVDAYLDMHLQQRENNATLRLLPAYAAGTDLDHIASRYGVKRLLIKAATATTEAVHESDEALRRRMILALEATSTAGPTGAYVYHALSADGRVKDALAYSPAPAEVVVVVQSHIGKGAADDELVGVVAESLNASNVRPAGDQVTVKSAEIVEYELDATLLFYPGPSHAPALELANTYLQAYRAESEKIGHWITDSAIKRALHQPGVYSAVVDSPAELPLRITQDQCAWCINITLRDGGNVDQ